MTGLLLAGWLFAAPLEEPPSDLVLQGRVRMEAYGASAGLPGAFIEVWQGGRAERMITDDRGRYRIEGLRPGEAVLRVHHLAAEPHRIDLTLPSSGTMEVDILLERRLISLPEVHARAIRSEPVRPLEGSPFTQADPRHPAVRLRVMESSSGIVESGLAQHRTELSPGEEERPPEHALFMRGSTVDSRMVLLDGVPILTPFHLAGLVPSFDPRALGSAEVFLGGAPSRYEGGLSYILDVESRAAQPDEPRLEVALDGLALRGGASIAHSDRGGLAVTARSFHGAQAALTPTSVLPYSFEDLLVRSDLEMGWAGELRMTYFRNREGVVLETGGPEGALEGERTRWGNQALSTRWSRTFGDHRIDLLGAVARYGASLPVLWEEPVVARTDTERRRLELRGTSLRSFLGWDGVLRWGASFERQNLRYLLSPHSDGGWESETLSRLTQEPSTVQGDRMGLFAEFDTHLTDRIRVQGGGRLDHFDRVGGVYPSPRGSLQVALTDDALLTISGGAFHQYLPEPGLEEEEATRETAPHLEWRSGLGLGSASHLVVELDQMLTEDLSLGVSGFVKRFRERREIGDRGVNASGTDLRISRMGERTDGWLGYSLSWFWEPRAGMTSADEFRGRHLLTAGGRARSSTGFEMGISVEYGAGLPLTEVPLSVDEEGRRPNVRSLSGSSSVSQFAEGGEENPLDLIHPDDFLRIDLEASWVTHPVLGGRSTELRPYFRLLNALNRRDSLFYYFEEWRGPEVRPVAERSVLPLFGLEWRF